MNEIIADPNKPAMTFPCAVPVSAIGLMVEGLAQAVSEVVAGVVSDFDAHTITLQASRTGKYLSVRFTATVQDKAQLMALDAALRAHPHIIRVI